MSLDLSGWIDANVVRGMVGAGKRKEERGKS
jgi:hypothetical protein